eukprot:CAMPEP_0184335164 /NCGR_PEP_ID=MMETSP1089-20130417/3782_1 /TAXON_ID=38269 ORGANISM="Gloeochaete wittrockiana, Strain SAG46.84" /NCGR_SAMPLE_ID=MMETSP1089 /ASSEMBLY_ACC=CAM_ASM_000445 /LENGTH=292 /DNA_ID=CAMNT_0026659703 /DNA_START=40 /DNA_END=919 /DNA_ORIENTATION=+
MECVFVKLGGSLVTDKGQAYTLRRDVLKRLCHEIAKARRSNPGLRILLGHGAGSFGHCAVVESGFRNCAEDDTIFAMAKVAASMRTLNAEICASLVQEGIPAIGFSPSNLGAASIVNGSSKLSSWSPTAIEHMKAFSQRGGVPVVHGDVCFVADYPARGGSAVISTEKVFDYLVPFFEPVRIFLFGEVDGVLDRNPHEHDTPGGDTAVVLFSSLSYQEWVNMSNSPAGMGTDWARTRGVDVTGGMFGKVNSAFSMLTKYPQVQDVWIASGLEISLVERALEGHTIKGTRLHR